MAAPYRMEIYLRPGPGDRVERSLDRQAWTDTGLSRNAVVDERDGVTLGKLLDDQAGADTLEGLEALLPDHRQRNIGRALHLALLGGTGPLPPQTRWLHLVPTDLPADEPARDRFLDFVLRVPWTLMTAGPEEHAAFLARHVARPVSITIDGAPGRTDRAWFADVRLPPRPNILLIVPVKQAGEPTQSRKHLANLSKTLKAHYKESFDAKVRHVTTLNGLARTIGGELVGDKAAGFNADIVYFYGHADTQDAGTVLQVDPDAAAPDGVVEIGLVLGLVEAMTQRTQAPPVIWFNGCKTGAAQYASCIRRFAPFASTVIATRTLAAVEDSLVLGETVLPKIAIGGHSPHSAVRDVTAKLRPETQISARWATTIVAVQYEMWSALENDAQSRDADSSFDLDSIGDIPVRLDRKKPLECIAQHVFAGLARDHAGPDVVVWRGDPDQGLVAFERRFIDLMLETPSDWSPVVRRIDLQLDGKPARGPGEYDQHFLSHLQSGLVAQPPQADGGGVTPQSLDRMIGSLLLRPRSVLVLPHAPVDTPQLPLLEDYIAFWAALCGAVGLVGAERRIVVGLSLRDSSGVAFASRPSLEVKLEKVDVAGLSTHLDRFRRFYPLRLANAEPMIAQTDGAFRKLYAELRRLLNIQQWKRLEDIDG